MLKTILIPPDGGYGWVIVFASALNNFFVIPLLQNFGMIFKDTFARLGFSAAQGSLIITLNSAFGMMTGLINGPLLNNFGYRKISMVGATMLSTGVFITAFVDSFAGFLISYGLIASLGLGLTMSSYSLAINTYFKERKSKAIAFSMTLTGLGPIIMPQVINLLIENYNTQGVTLILSSICANSFVAATLLQPVKYHMKKKVVEEELSKIEEEQEVETDDDIVEEVPVPTRYPLIRSYSQVEGPRSRIHRKDSALSVNYELEAAGIYGIDSTLGGSVFSLTSAAPNKRKSVISNHRDDIKTKWWTSESTINLNSSYNLFEEKSRRCNSESNQNSKLVPQENNKVYNELSVERKEKKPLWKRILLRIVVLFDLTLLKDPVYCNIMFGMSLAVFAELMFSVLTVFILNDFGLTTSQIATFLSCLGVTDITFRFLAPYIGDLLKQPHRVMYLITLLSLITTRSSLLIFSEYKYLIGVAIALGAAKGIRIVFMSLVIPTYVPLERLAAASGIQMMVNGIFIITGGPLLGVVRDLTGSYSTCIVIMNSVTFSTVIMWSTEFLIARYKRKHASNEVQEHKKIPNNP